MPSAQYRIKARDLLETTPDEPVLVVKPISADPENLTSTDEIAILSQPSALGTGSIAYLVYGIPGTDQYVFFDLNHLPQNYRASLVLSDTSGTVHSANLWEGNLGNSPQPTSSE